MLYNWQFFDKRNRLCHNMVMEHFEVHKEQLEDLIIDLDKNGPKILIDIPEPEQKESRISLDELALIDEISGLTPFIDNFLLTHDIPLSMRSRLESRIFRYSGEKPKEIALNELRDTLYGNNR